MRQSSFSRYTKNASSVDVLRLTQSGKANCLFRNYEVKGYADRVIVYLTLYISQCLTHLSRNQFDKDSALKELSASDGLRQCFNDRVCAQELYQFAIKNFQVPGDKGFPLGGMVTAPQNRGETDMLKQYFTQLRQETGVRLCEQIYAHDTTIPSKWWMCYAKKKFLNQELQ
jgi:actin related protein 2/3 complex subunit 3